MNVQNFKFCSKYLKMQKFWLPGPVNLKKMKIKKNPHDIFVSLRNLPMNKFDSIRLAVFSRCVFLCLKLQFFCKVRFSLYLLMPLACKCLKTKSIYNWKTYDSILGRRKMGYNISKGTKSIFWLEPQCTLQFINNLLNLIDLVQFSVWIFSKFNFQLLDVYLTLLFPKLSRPSGTKMSAVIYK